MNMTRQEQLDAVVRNYGNWSLGDNLLVFWNHGIVDYVLPGELKNGNFRAEYYCFTRAEVEARKAELQNKPSWDDAPEWAEYLSQDVDTGVWCWYSSEPTISDKYDEFGFCGKDWKAASTGEVIGDWRYTLEKRPETVSSGDTKWDGKDLPPVGTLCEAYDLETDKWVKGKVLMHSKGYFHAFASGERQWGKLFWSSRFRPIKSDREKWVVAVTKKTGLPVPTETLEAIYDEGFGKMPEDV